MLTFVSRSHAIYQFKLKSANYVEYN